MRRLLTGCVVFAWATAPAFASGPCDAERAQAREIFQTVVEMDTSVDGGKTPAMAKYLEKRFRDGGFAADDVLRIEHEKAAALVVRYRGDGSGGKPIALLAHMDVVPAQRADWERDPFKLIEENGYFFARGWEDNKSGVAILTSLFLTLKAEKFTPTRDLVIVFTGDEETSGNTAKLLLNKDRAWVDAEFALNTDAGGGQVSEAGEALFYTMQTAENIRSRALR